MKKYKRGYMYDLFPLRDMLEITVMQRGSRQARLNDTGADVKGTGADTVAATEAGEEKGADVKDRGADTAAETEACEENGADTKGDTGADTGAQTDTGAEVAKATERETDTGTPKPTAKLTQLRPGPRPWVPSMRLSILVVAFPLSFVTTMPIVLKNLEPLRG
ncbi:uncharacterized protein BYT42DRAFT_613603 [Radiomyces spectabilis]|uniref:uncharacterized protein n=1 Tax=Radiomyces spectabilis TaxID=64574 RepID=UPI00221F3240|nr:uncharacterized protein BYT42DRAFT_613603 [Radiomyces spectabilis]KAI8379278.1 hypothetical protein BYT42DRAFT_613603 [Radiomyces spectabilis]